MAGFTLERKISAPPEVVFDVLTNHRGYADITPVRKVELEREGDPAPDGVGAIRVIRGVGPALREEIVAYERPTRFSYTVLSGAPMRDHIGNADLYPSDGGTRIVYAVHMTPTVPLIGGAVVFAIKQAVGRLLDGVGKESERLAAAADG
jgi:uncharacterized protein YndB with AHSA1/START domain